MADETETTESAATVDAEAALSELKPLLVTKREGKPDQELRPTFVVPKSSAERYDFVWANEQGEVQTPRVYAGAIAVAWPRLRRMLHQRGVQYDGNVAVWGGKALDYLLDQGASFSAIAIWGKLALDGMAGGLPGIEVPQEDDDLGNPSEGDSKPSS